LLPVLIVYISSNGVLFSTENSQASTTLSLSSLCSNANQFQVAAGGAITMIEQAAPSTPASGYVAVYSKTDGLWYGKDDAGTETKLSNEAPAEGTYTPTLFNTTNVAASTAYTTHYSMVGNTITVWGKVAIDATAAVTLTELGMSLPSVAGAVNNDYDISGHCTFEDNTTLQVKGDVGNTRIVMRGLPQSATNNTYSFVIVIKYIAP